MRKNRVNNRFDDEKKIYVSNFDYSVFFTVILLVLFGIIMIFSASSYVAATRSEYNHDMFLFLKKQVFAVGLGFILMMFTANLNYRKLKRFAFWLYCVANFLLVFVFLFGTAKKGARRWIYLPVVGSFQPSELAKVAIILFISCLIASNKNILKDISGHIFCAVFVFLTVILIALANLSTAIIVSLIGFGIIFIPRQIKIANKINTIIAPKNPSSSHIIEKIISLCASGKNPNFCLLCPNPNPKIPPDATA